MQLRVTRARKVFSNGKHNAFTSLASFNGTNYLAFRSGSTHMTLDGKIILLRQTSADTWEEAAIYAKESHDLRDPHLIVFQGKILLYSLTRVQNGDNKDIVSFMASTEDGVHFTEMKKLSDICALWGLVQKDGILYATNYVLNEARRNYTPSLWKSTDGINWEKILEFPFPGTEVALDFDEDGSLWALVRDSTDGFGAIPTICQLLPPFNALQERSCKTFEKFLALPIRLHGPMIKRIAGHAIIVGRTWEANRSNLRTEIYIWSEGKDLKRICTLPSGGDTSYSAWLDTAPGKALLSYYSSHEHRMALTFEEEAIPDHPSAEHCTAADIFLADICWR